IIRSIAFLPTERLETLVLGAVVPSVRIGLGPGDYRCVFELSRVARCGSEGWNLVRGWLLRRSVLGKEEGPDYRFYLPIAEEATLQPLPVSIHA
ncbi:MAG: hypothetical protein ACK53L_21210, partial [Pirellulaceae bacterium]